MSANVGTAVGYLDLDINGFLSGLKTAQTEANKATTNIAQTVGTNMQKAGKNIEKAGTALTTSVTLPIVGAGTAIMAISTDFESAMSKVKAISGATGKDFDNLKAKAIELGASTAFSANEVAEGMTEMAKAGWTSSDIIDGMGGVLDAAAASGEQLASVSTIVADAITGFGLEAKDATKVADLLTQAANTGTIDITDLGESFKYVAPVAGALGITIEDATTAIAAMSTAGIKGSQAGTSLRTMLSRMVKPTKMVQEAMDALDFSAKNADGTFKGLPQILSELRVKFADLTDAEKAQYAAQLAGQEGMSGMLSILNMSQEEYDAIAASMANSSGVAQETATVMQDNLKSSVEQLGGALESLAIQLGDILLPYVKEFVDKLQTLVQRFSELSPEQQKQILKYAAMAAAIGPVLIVVGKLITGVGSVISVFGKVPGAISKVVTGFTGLGTKLVNVKEGFALAKAGMTSLGAQASPLGAALGGITAPIAGIIAVIALLVGAFVTLWKTNEEFRNNITAIWNQLKDVFSGFCNGIVERLNSLGFNFKSITDVIWTIWEGFCNLLAPIFEGIFQNIVNTLSTTFDVILGIVDFFIALFKGDWDGCWNAVKSVFMSIWNGIVSWFQNILNVITCVFDVVCSWFGTSWSAVWQSIKDFFVGIWNGIVEFATSTFDWFKTTWDTLWTAISDFFTAIWNGIKSFFEGIIQSIMDVVNPILDFFVGIFTSAWEGISTAFSVAVQWFKDLFEAVNEKVHMVIDPWVEIFRRIWIKIKEAFQPAIEFFTNLFSTAWNNIKTAWSVVVGFFQGIWTGIKNAFSAAIEWFKGIFEAAWSAIKTAWSAVTNWFSGVWSSIKQIFNSVATWFSGVFTSAWNGIKNAFASVKTFFSGIWTGIKGAFSNVAEWFGSVFSQAWQKVKDVFSTGGKIFDGIKDGILSALKSVVNGLIKGINKVIEVPFNGINGALKKIKKIEIVGVKPFDWIETFDVPQIPLLERGGVLKKGQTGFLEGNGAEAVVPLEKNTGWLKRLAGMLKEELGSTSSIPQALFNSLVDGIMDLSACLNNISENIRTFCSVLHQDLSVFTQLSKKFISGDKIEYVGYNGFAPRTKTKSNSNVENDNNTDSNGDTYIFNSPRAIDEIEAARQMKKVKRELAEGF